MSKNYPRVVIAGTHSGVGKTLISTILMSFFSKKTKVQAFKVGPDYLDPLFHQYITKTPSYNLDSFLLPPQTLQALFLKHAPEEGRGLSIIEGVMGLHDGLAATPQASTCEVAELLEAPTILVINAEGLSRSAAALVKGYKELSKKLNLAGVIFNKVSSARHYQILKTAVEAEVGLPCLGYLPKNIAFNLKSRALGLQPPEEQRDFDKQLKALLQVAEESLDFAAIEQIALKAKFVSFAAEKAKLSELINVLKKPFAQEKIRLGVFKDAAFCFYYADNLELLESLGVELVFVSPLKDKALPTNLAGLYAGGGYPELYLKELAENSTFMLSLHQALAQGLPFYAEAAGLLYLCRKLCTKEGISHKLTGFFTQTAEIKDNLQNFGYLQMSSLGNNFLLKKGVSIPAHEFHYGTLLPRSIVADAQGAAGGDELASAVFKMQKFDGRTWQGGLLKRNCLATFAHLHFYSDPELVINFLTLCVNLKSKISYA